MQNRIDKVLNEQGKTYKDLVPLTGLSEYGIGQMAKAGDDETFGTWLSIARALDVSPAYLVGWSDEKRGKEVKRMAEIPKIDFGKGYSYRPTVGVFKDNHLVIDEETLFAITYWQDFVTGMRHGIVGGADDEN